MQQPFLFKLDQNVSEVFSEMWPEVQEVFQFLSAHTHVGAFSLFSLSS